MHRRYLPAGQQQRVAEPFSALDSHLRFQLEREVRDVIRRFGKAVLLVSHDRDEVFRLADHVAVMHSGKIEASGEKHAVFAAPATMNGARLTGCKNISAARLLDGEHILACDWGLTLRTAGDTAGVTHAGIRMHDVRLCQDGAGENVFRFQVAGEIENPFSVTVMLCPAENGQAVPLGMELPKDVWAAGRRAEIWAALPPEGVILLKG